MPKPKKSYREKLAGDKDLPEVVALAGSLSGPRKWRA